MVDPLSQVLQRGSEKVRNVAAATTLSSSQLYFYFQFADSDSSQHPQNAPTRVSTSVPARFAAFAAHRPVPDLKS